jgi:hypothetical protein
MPGRSRFIVAAVSLSALAACGRIAPATDAALQRDLDLAKGQGLELAPQGSARSTLSADELIPSGNRTKSTAQQATKSREPRRATPAQISPPPPGGYKTMGELIRQAPFPINP